MRLQIVAPVLTALFCCISQGTTSQRIAEVFVSAPPHTYHFRGIYGLFGPEVSLSTAYLYESPIPDACTPITFVPPKGQENEPFVLFAMRGGDCTYSMKAQNCKNAGASGVIIGNYNLNQIMFMAGNDTVDIPSVSVTGQTVLAVSTMLRKGDVTVTITVGPDLLSLQHGFVIMMINTLAILFAFGLSMGCFSLFMRYKRIALEHARLQEAEEVKRLAKEKIEAIVNALEVSVYKKTMPGADLEAGIMQDDEEEADCCAICLEEMEDEDEIRLLPLCVHGTNFHLVCLDQWLMDVQSCPMCKAKLNEEESECESEEAEEAEEAEAESTEIDPTTDNAPTDCLLLTRRGSDGDSEDDDGVGHVMGSHALSSTIDGGVEGSDSDEEDSVGHVGSSHFASMSDRLDLVASVDMNTSVDMDIDPKKDGDVDEVEMHKRTTVVA